MHRMTLLVCLIGLADFRPACAAEAFQMPLAGTMGATPKVYKQPDGTIIQWIEFFGENMRHVYYQGAAGVVVRAWQSTKQDMSTDFFASPWSELSFIVSGETTITNEGGTALSLKAGDSFFIARGAKVKVTAHNLRKLAVVFDMDSQ